MQVLTTAPLTLPVPPPARGRWQVRNLELHQLLRSASIGDGAAGDAGVGGEASAGAGTRTDSAAATLLEVAKQQAQRDEELMAARIQVAEPCSGLEGLESRDCSELAELCWRTSACASWCLRLPPPHPASHPFSSPAIASDRL